MQNGYYSRDAASMVSSLENSSINVTVTSPPYGAMKDYGSINQIGFGQTYDEYLNSLVNIFAVLHRKTVANGSLWVVADTFKEKSQLRLLPFDLATRLSGVGWNLKDIIIWDKTKTLPWSGRGQLRRTFEYILFFAKTSSFKYHVDRIKELDNLKEWWVKYPERYSPEGKVPTSIWSFPIPVQGSWSRGRLRHFCPFPSPLVERILTLTTDPGDCVLDPFAGSGVVLAQAKAMRRRYLGSDVNRSYRQQFQRFTADHVGRRWHSTKHLRAENGSKQAALADSIYRLRQTKFPKALFKELQRTLGSSGLIGVRLIVVDAARLKDPPAPHCFAKLAIYMLCNAAAPLTVIEDEARRLATKPPLSKYGIISDIHAVRCDDDDTSCIRNLPRRRRLFLYTEGATHHYIEQFSGRKWVTAVPGEWKRIPPIICNVGVRQIVVRTWSPRAD
ncbi:MAG TPA: site-specific DNA-methyltransferase [Terriglobales bacterium]|jgi:DNA modification methylase